MTIQPFRCFILRKYCPTGAVYIRTSDLEARLLGTSINIKMRGLRRLFTITSARVLCCQQILLFDCRWPVIPFKVSTSELSLRNRSVDRQYLSMGNDPLWNDCGHGDPFSARYPRTWNNCLY